MGEQYLVNKRELAALLDLDHRRHGHAAGHPAPGRYDARDLITRWRKHGLIKTIYRSRRGVHAYLTADGLHISGLPYTARKLTGTNISSLDHHDAVNRLRLHLEADFDPAQAECYWVSERRLMQEQPLSLSSAVNAQRRFSPLAERVSRYRAGEVKKYYR